MTHMVNAPIAGPVCPRCRRKLAAWRLDHCVYCGEKFPENIREGFTEPEALQYVERPDVPPDAAKQLDMMRYVEIGAEKKPRGLGRALALLTIPVFVVIFYLLYRLATRIFPQASILVVVLAVGLLGYIVWTVAKSNP
jgi:Zn ribbon nucleic-acid-binding protein